MLLTRVFGFESAHQLPNYHGKCENLHGHHYKLEVTIEGKVGSDGMIIDFHLLSKIVDECVIEPLDHHYLNDIIENPSAENIAVWIFGKIKPVLPKTVSLHRILVFENDQSKVECSAADLKPTV
jgi:6-pyruvoyltetrahydropterin/6-carboxytetrahydropterin synthase